MQAALQQETVVIERNGVKITMRGDQQILEVEIDGIIENRIAESVNEAVKKTQELAAKKLIEISQPYARVSRGPVLGVQVISHRGRFADGQVLDIRTC